MYHEMMDIKQYRKSQLQSLTDEIGVYALCDLDFIPIYIGQSKNGIRYRVQRHLTSARSDVIANRQLDVWEVAQVWAWPMPGSTNTEINELENFLLHQFNDESPLVNGKIPQRPTNHPAIPEKQMVEILPADELELRKNPTRRLPRQLEHLGSLFSHILEVKNNPEQRRMLKVHFDRMSSYYKNFMEESGESIIA